MLGAKWMVSATDQRPVEIEFTDQIKDVQAFYNMCLSRLPEMQLKHVNTPPIGFYVIDNDWRVLRRFMPENP